jgi:hypothetical protein
VGGLVPTTANDVLIANGHTVIIDANATCGNLTIQTGDNSNTLSINPGVTLTVNNGVTIDVSTHPGRDKTIDVGGGTFTCTSITMNDPLIVNADCILSISTGTVNVTGNITMHGAPWETYIVFSGAGMLNVGGSVSGGGILQTTAAGTVNYNGSSAQTVMMNEYCAYHNLYINNSAGATLEGTITSSNVNGDVRVQSGVFDNGGFAITGNAGQTFEVANGAALNLTDTSGMATGFGTISLGSTSTVDYAGTNQTVSNELYGHLTLSGSGTKTMPGSSMTIAGNFSMSGTASAAAGAALVVHGNFTIGAGATFNAGTFSHSTKGNWSNAGTFNANTGTFTFNGTSAQSVDASAFNNFTVSNSVGVVLAGSLTVNGTLTFANGKLTLGSNNLTIGSSGSISGASTLAFVVTNGTGTVIRSNVSATARLFPVGTASTYNPATISNSGTVDNFSVRVQSTFDNPPIDPNAVVNRQWTITEGTAGGSSATITLQWNAADEATGFVRTNPIVVGHYTGSQWVSTSAAYSNLGGGVYTASASGFTGFSPFGVGNDAALPIQLATLTGVVLQSGAVRLDWMTLSELNNYGFYVQRRSVGQQIFTSISNVFVPGHGTTVVPQYYTFTDVPPAGGTWFYRLKQIDLDGTLHYSDPIRIDVPTGVENDKAPTAFSLGQNYPNPFNPSTTIRFSISHAGPVKLSVFDMLGREVARLVDEEKMSGTYFTVWNPEKAATGTYFYCLRSGGLLEVKRLMLIK